MSLNPIGFEFEVHGHRFKVIGHEKSYKGEMVEKLQSLGPVGKKKPEPVEEPPVEEPVPAMPVPAAPALPMMPMKNPFGPRSVKINEQTKLNISRSGVSMSMQLMPGLRLMFGGRQGTRLNVNMGPVRFSRSLGKKKKGKGKRKK